MDETPTILRLSIDGRWSADDMMKSFRSLKNLYNLRLAIQIAEDRRIDFERYYGKRIYPSVELYFDSFFTPIYSNLFVAGQRELRDIISAVDSADELQVRRIEYASPGFKDLLGVGEVIKQLGKLVGDIIRMPQELQAKSEEIKKMRIENARRYVRLRLETAEADRRIRHLAKLATTESAPLIELAEQGKLSSVEVLPEKESQ